MQSVKGKEGGSGVQIEHSDITRSTGQEKKVVPFRDGQARGQPGMSILSSLSVPVLRCDQPVKEPAPVSGDGQLPVSKFCENAEFVQEHLKPDSLRIFRDRLGIHWSCKHPFTCPHAVIMHGKIHSCRKRVHDIRTMKVEV